ncbi:MAG: hypothetical protein JST50_05350 [Bacteroidetes bacterium]|jgi:hypothetical protein|nr:hypothetical protein [Bacteroidota bacterium]
MNRTLLLIMIATLFSCKNSAIKKNDNSKDTISNTHVLANKEPNIISGNETDMVYISTDDGDTLGYTKGELRKILKAFPELTDEFPRPPDESYASAKNIRVDLGNNSTFSLDCELCRDDYYRVYAYFLKMSDGNEQYKVERERLIKLYRDIGFITARLENWGNGYGHLSRRILGYAEYSVYRLSADKNEGYFKKSYDIKKQKALYIAMLKQTIDDEVNNDTETLPKDKPSRKKELLKTVDEINSLITDYFYLKMTQQFQSSNY